MEVKEIKTVVENLADFIDVPNGIERLKDAVLSLATAGLLTEQKKDDGSSEDLYGEIIKHNPKLKSKSPTVDQMDGPYKVPSNWKWVKLNSVFSIVGGGTPRSNIASNFVEPQNDKAIHWITPADIRKLTDSMYVSHGKRSISKQGFKSSSAQLLPKGSILFSSRAPIGYVRIAKNDLTTNQGFKSCVPFDNKSVDAKYVFWFLKSRVLSISENATGTTFKEVSGKSFGDEYFALPPLAEQKRIVERVDELMKLIDQLVLEKKERDEVRGKMAVSAFYSFGTEHNEFALKHLTELVKTPSDVDELEKSILSLAVSGKLTPQDPEDGNAEDLYQEIRKEKESVGTSNKKIKPLSPITDEEIVFGIPANWKWVRLGDLAKVITDGEHISPTKTTEGVPLLTAKNATDNGVTFEKIDYVTKEDAAKFWNRCNPEKGDLLICSRVTIGRSVVVDTEEKFVLMGSVILIKFFNDETATFVRNYLRTQSGLLQIGAMKKGMAVNAIYLKDIRNAVLPLPPIKEQTRIVAKVNELMILVQKLREVMDK